MSKQLCKIADEETGLCNVCMPGYDEYYINLGYEYHDIDLSEIDNKWYLSEKCPHKTNEQNVAEMKSLKHKENDEKVKVARYGQVFNITLQEKDCVFDTSEQTQSDLQTAAIVTSTGGVYPNWVTNNNITIDLTNEDVQAVFIKFFERVSPLYTIYKNYEIAIDKAKTIKALEKIDIRY